MAEYRLDGSNMKTKYGITVLRSVGSLDQTKRKGKTGHNWLDEDGEEEYTDTNDIYYEPRDISLDILIQASTRLAFLTNLDSFKSTLQSPGLHTLYIGATCVTHSVYMKDGFKLKPATKWSSQLTVATFRLKLREPDPARS